MIECSSLIAKTLKYFVVVRRIKYHADSARRYAGLFEDTIEANVTTQAVGIRMKFPLRKDAHLTYRVAALGIFALLTCAGCATSMSYSTSPQTLEPGEVSGGIEGQFSLNTTVVDKGIDTLKIAGYYATDSDDLTEEEYRELLDAVVAYALFRPSVAGEVAMRVGVFEGADVGIRYNASILKGDAKVRVWQSPDESSVVSVTAGIGQGGSLGPSNLKYITWQEFNRLDAELSIMYGYEEADFFRVYAGPRLIHTWLTVDPVLSP